MPTFPCRKQVEDVLPPSSGRTVPIELRAHSAAWSMLTRKAWVWDDSGDPLKYEIQDVPADMVDLVEEWRETPELL